MIILKVKEKTYKENSNIKHIFKESRSAIILSIDINSIPIKGIIGRWVLIEDITCRLYFVSLKNKSKHDIKKIDYLKRFAEDHPTIIRKWFEPYSPGRYELKVDLTNPDQIGNQYLIFQGIKDILPSVGDSINFDDLIRID